MLIWTIHDFPRYGIIFGCQHQGIKACPFVEQTLCLGGLNNWGRFFSKALKGGFERIIHIRKTQMHNILMGLKNSRGGGAQQQ
jgi:hypothetical protein